MNRENQLAELESNYEALVATIRSLAPDAFLHKVGGWSPRDGVVAHLIGWNRNTVLGCEELRGGRALFYHMGGPNDYRIINAESVTRYVSTDRETLLRELAESIWWHGKSRAMMPA